MSTIIRLMNWSWWFSFLLLKYKDIICTVRNIELPKDYDCTIEYHPGKANVVVDALSRRLQVKPIRVQEIKYKQGLDDSLAPRFKQVKHSSMKDFRTNSDGILCYEGRYCILNYQSL
ncbi:integrase [Gossypium australe]|uniref:Integrase n=1 Tax=Gossypium australe TaxID=47621 RepID=A0A5B6X2H8_9ROSI|nr:integrase [Gossypium australe]